MKCLGNRQFNSQARWMENKEISFCKDADSEERGTFYQELPFDLGILLRNLAMKEVKIGEIEKFAGHIQYGVEEVLFKHEDICLTSSFTFFIIILKA